MAESDDISLSLDVTEEDVEQDVYEQEEHEMSYFDNNDHDYSSAEPTPSTSTGSYGSSSRPTTTDVRVDVSKTQSKIDSFAVKQIDPHHLPKNITACDRAKMYPNQLHESGGKLFCTVCNVVIDHMRVFAVKQHLLTKKHLSRSSDLGGCSGQRNVKCYGDVKQSQSPKSTIPPVPTVTVKSVTTPARKKKHDEYCDEESILTTENKKEPSKVLKQQTIAACKKQTEVAKIRYEVMTTQL